MSLLVVKLPTVLTAPPDVVMAPLETIAVAPGLILIKLASLVFYVECFSNLLKYC